MATGTVAAGSAGDSSSAWNRYSGCFGWNRKCICVPVEQMECQEGSCDGNFHGWLVRFIQHVLLLFILMFN